NDRLTKVVRTNSSPLTHVNQSVGAFVRDPLALQAALRRRGWSGGLVQSYGLTSVDDPSLTVVMEVYATAAGAAESVGTNDFSEYLDPIPALAQIGDQTVSYRGTWLDTGDTVITFRRGNVVFTVDYFDQPGFDRNDTLI